MKTIYIVEFTSGEYEDFRKHIAGVSETLAGANRIRNNFLDLLREFEKKRDAMEKDVDKLTLDIINYQLAGYKPNSIAINEVELERLFVNTNKIQ